MRSCPSSGIPAARPASRAPGCSRQAQDPGEAGRAPRSRPPPSIAVPRAARGTRESPARPHQSEKVGAPRGRRESTKRFRLKELIGRSKWPFAEAASKLDQRGSPARPAPLRLPPVPAQSETATETSVGRPSPRLPYRTRATIPRGGL